MTPVMGFKIRRPSSVVRVQAPSRLGFIATAALLCGAPWSTADAVDFNEEDKRLHAVVGFVVGAGTSTVCPGPWWMRALAGTATASAIGVAKEIYDAQHQGQHTSDGDDALATAAGGAVGATMVSGISFFASQDSVAAAVAWSF